MFCCLHLAVSLLHTLPPLILFMIARRTEVQSPQSQQGSQDGKMGLLALSMGLWESPEDTALGPLSEHALIPHLFVERQLLAKHRENSAHTTRMCVLYLSLKTQERKTP